MGLNTRRRARAAATAALVAMTICAAPAPGHAQTGPADPGRAIDALRSTRDAAPGPLSGPPSIPLTSQTPPANAAEISFRLSGLELAGGTIYAPDALSPLYAEMLGREIRLDQLFEIAARIQARYREDGFLFTRVIVPAQQIIDGRARLDVIEAVLETVSVEEPAAPLGPVRALAEEMVAPLRGLKNPTLADIETVLLSLSDLPGITRAAAVPKIGGDARGAVRLFINMERKPWDVVLFADNRQAPLAGRGLYGVVAAYNSWTEAADSTTLSLFGSADFDDEIPDDFTERWTAQIEHRRNLGHGGAQLYGRALYSETRPGAEVAALDIFGAQAELEIGVETPVILSRALSIRARAGLEMVEMDSLVPGSDGGDDLITADDSLRVIFGAVALTQRDPWGATEAELEARIGLDILGATQAGDEGISRNDGDGRFALIRGRAARTLSFPELAPLSFWVEASGQVADRALLSFEEFSIGGPGLGRAFDPTEFAGDIGFGLAAEIRWPTHFTVQDQRVDATFYGFGDYARVKNLSGGAPGQATLISAGLGVRTALPGDVSLNLEAAKPVNRPLQRTESEDWRFFFSASKQF